MDVNKPRHKNHGKNKEREKIVKNIDTKSHFYMSFISPLLDRQDNFNETFIVYFCCCSLSSSIMETNSEQLDIYDQSKSDL